MQVETSDTEVIFFDSEKDGRKRRMAPVDGRRQGRRIARLRNPSVKPAYIKDKRVHDAHTHTHGGVQPGNGASGVPQ